MTEEWKDIEGHQEYQISNLGRVKSKAKRGHTSEIIMKQQQCKLGYSYISIHNSKVKCKTFKIHRLVAQHFIPNPHKKREVNHKDGNKSNNMVNNLEWCTHSENMKHAFENNLRRIGEKHYKSKLKEKEVLEIREMFGKGIKQCEISNTFKCSQSLVSRICNNMYWKHILKEDK